MCEKHNRKISPKTDFQKQTDVQLKMQSDTTVEQVLPKTHFTSVLSSNENENEQ